MGTTEQTSTAAPEQSVPVTENNSLSKESEMADAPFVDPPGRWYHLNKFLNRTGPKAGPSFEPDTAANPKLKKLLSEDCRVLVIGAGGLGCEILKDLALSGFRNIEVIDMDVIEVSNLNRQFLFRKADVGKSKAEVAAAFIRQRVPGCNVVPFYGRIEAKGEDYYRRFNFIIAGLDSIEARRWINATLVNMVALDDDNDPDPDTIIPLVDGGTEGFKGHVRVIIPRISSCFECMLDAFPPQVVYPECTIAFTPRLPEHCIIWASTMEWPHHWKETRFDADRADHMQWVYETAVQRALAYNISGVTLKLTQGVVKNIIPAVASTNAAIAAACVNEALKIATDIGGYLENYMMYNGVTGMYSYTFDYERKPDCLVCGSSQISFAIRPDALVQEIINRLHEDPVHRLRKPTLFANHKPIFVPGALAEQLRANLQRPISDFVKDGDVIVVTDPGLPSVCLELKIQMQP